MVPEEQRRDKDPKDVVEEGEREESYARFKVLELDKRNDVYAKKDCHDVLEYNGVDAVASGEPHRGKGKREKRGDNEPD